MSVKHFPTYVNVYLEDSSGNPITSGVAAKVWADGGAAAVATNAPVHVDDGSWRLLVTGDENDGDCMAAKFIHSNCTAQVQWNNVGNCAIAAGVETVEHTYTVTDSVSGDPIQGVLVEVKLRGTQTKIGWAYTDVNGQATFNLEADADAEKYDFYCFKPPYRFNNPDQDEVIE